jgi:hypothetical protein
MRTPVWSRVPQLELFRPSLPTPTLPPEVSRKTVELLARLLREHAQQLEPPRPGREVGHE